MNNKIFKIFILSILLVIMWNAKSLAVVSKDVNKKVSKWLSGGLDGWTDEDKQEHFDEILNNLKEDFEYKGNDVTNEMKVHTTISIVDKTQTALSHLPWVKTKYKYKIRIRNWKR